MVYIVGREITPQYRREEAVVAMLLTCIHKEENEGMEWYRRVLVIATFMFWSLVGVDVFLLAMDIVYPLMTLIIAFLLTGIILFTSRLMYETHLVIRAMHRCFHKASMIYSLKPDDDPLSSILRYVPLRDEVERKVASRYIELAPGLFETFFQSTLPAWLYRKVKLYYTSPSFVKTNNWRVSAMINHNLGFDAIS